MFPTITTWSWGTGPQPCKGHLEQSPCCTRHLSRESTRCFSNRHTCHSSTGGQGQIQQKNLITGLYPSPQDRRTPIQTLQPLTAPSPSPWCPHTKKWKSPFPSHSAESQRAKGFILSPRQKWWLRKSYLWTLLQLSRAEPATLHHLPPTSAFSQGVLEPTHEAVIQAQCPSTAKEVTLKGTLDSQCSGEATGASSPHRDNIFAAKKDLMSLSSLFPDLFLLVSILCSQNSAPNTQPKSSLQWGCFFQCLIAVAVITECHVAAQHCTAVSPKPS